MRTYILIFGAGYTKIMQMSTKPKAQKTPIKVWADKDFKKMLRKFRAIKDLRDEPVSSEEKAIIILAKRGYEAEIINA